MRGKRNFILILVLFVFIGNITYLSAYSDKNHPEPDKPLVDTLISALKDKRWTVRWYAAEFLGHIRDTKAVDGLIGCLKDEVKEVLIKAAETLGKIKDRRAVKPLLELLEGRVSYGARTMYSPAFTEGAAEALGNIGDPEAVEPLISNLKHSDPDIREKAARALGKIKDKRALGPLLSTLGDKADRVRRAAAAALGHMDEPEAVNALLALVSNRYEAWGVRKSAAEALGNLKDLRAAAPLIELLNRGDSYGREIAALALGNIGGQKVVKPLLNAFSTDKSKRVRLTAALSLYKLEYPGIMNFLAASLKENDLYRRQHTAVILGETGDERGVEPLIRCLQESNWFVKVKIFEALGKIGNRKAVAPLLPYLKDKNHIIRTKTAEALGRIGDPGTLGPLSALVNDPEWAVRESAAEALGKIGNPKSMDALVRLLEDSDWLVRIKAAEALCKMPGQKAVKPLINALKDTRWKVRDIGRDKAVFYVVIFIFSLFVLPIIIAFITALVVYKMMGAIGPLIDRTFRFIYSKHESTKNFAVDVSKSVEARWKKIEPKCRYVFYGLLALGGGINLIKMAISSVVKSVSSTRELYEALTKFMAYFGLLFLLYLLFLSILASILTILELRKHRIDKKGMEIFTLGRYFNSLAVLIIQVLLLFFGYYIYGIAIRASIPFCYKSYFLWAGNSPDYDRYLMGLYTNISMLDNILSLLISLAPYILFGYALLFVGLAVPYLFLRKWQYAFLVCVIFVLSISLGNLLNDFISGISVYSGPFLLVLCIVATFFALHLFLMLVQNVFEEESPKLRHQLSPQTRDPVTKKTIAYIVDRFKCAGQLEKDDLVSLCESFVRIYDREVAVPQKEKSKETKPCCPKNDSVL